jgi:hypothetical protein
VEQDKAIALTKQSMVDDAVELGNEEKPRVEVGNRRQKSGVLERLPMIELHSETAREANEVEEGYHFVVQPEGFSAPATPISYRNIARLTPQPPYD